MPRGRASHRETEREATDGRPGPRIGVTFSSARRASIRALAHLPRPVRLLWISLAILGGYGVAFNLQWIGLLPLLALPAVAAESDILLQVFRFRSVRAPDAALATGMFLALLLPPTVPLLQAGAVTVAAITLRHALRYRERPLLNPAVVGVLVGSLLFGMAPSWWGSINVALVIVLGIVLTLRTPDSWRMPVSFLSSYAALSIAGGLLFRKAISPQVLLLGAFDPSILFFGLFMISEPRTSPADSKDRLLFGALVGVATALLPAVIPSLAPLVALLLGNLMAVVTRRLPKAAPEPKSRRGRAVRRGRRGPRNRHDRQPPSPDAWHDWKIGHRIAAGLLVFALLGTMGIALNPPSSTPFAAVRPSLPSAGSGGSVANLCARDNPSVPSDMLTFLHQRLGPSIILSASPSSGTVIFYDPVNHATVTETDMYEDFGYAEFNGDDSVIMGCSP